MNGHKVKVGLMGLGTVGTGVIRLLEGHQDDLKQQTGVQTEIAKVLVQNPGKERSVNVQSDLITTDPYSLLHDPEIDVIVEVMGGIEPTLGFILEALEQGKHVVTANKDLMALHGAEILKKAAEKNCDVFYEASVAGGIPILRALVEGFSSDRITKMMGIVNGTTNYILTKMSQEGASYDAVLKEAQQLGYAEADPTSDVGGIDAARKMSILSTLGFHAGMNLEDVSCKGISEVTSEDIEYGKKLGYVMKLIGIAKQDDELIEVSVEPTFVKNSHPLASVNGVFNAVYVYGEAVGETMFYGPGAGELPTATAVVSDLVTVVKNMKLGVNGRGMVAPYKEKKLKKDEEIFAKYFIRFIVDDKSGVLSQVTKTMADYDVSLEQVMQQPYNKDHKAELIIVTHSSSKKSIQNILTQLEMSDYVNEIKSFYRVEGGE
ncbi:homoserine dehydrogenase [Bacillus pinisoli]|uniref:homoserine dehydrogenase n=1 Tax=Bacillus pinisoli TaxID=2901866 RepID=UPI001FF4D86F|nr:homoserine dehydrogenase [Bacillus pinisoli]